MKIKSKRVLRIVVCLLLSTGVLACSFSVFADNDPVPTSTPYPGTEDNPLMQNNMDDIAFIIYQLLESWGISVTYQDIVGYTGEVETQIQNWIWEYLDEQPSIENVLAWTMDWWFGTDFWGYLVVNDTLLDDVEAFSSWLENKYGLTNNSTYVVDGIYTVNGYTLFAPGRFYSVVGDEGLPLNTFVAMEGTRPELDNVNILGYTVIYRPYRSDGNDYDCIIYMRTNSNTQWQFWGLTTDDQRQPIMSGNTSDLKTNVHGYYTCSIGMPFQYSTNQTYLPQGTYFTAINANAYNDFMVNSAIEQEGDMKIVTYGIVTPSVDPSYTPGDGMTVINGHPEYGEITIPDSVSVSNLPAVIQPSKIEDPQIDQFYDFIPSFIDEAGDSMNFFKQIIFRMPDEVLYCIYAVLASGVIFGFLRILREH